MIKNVVKRKNIAAVLTALLALGLTGSISAQADPFSSKEAAKLHLSTIQALNAAHLPTSDIAVNVNQRTVQLCGFLKKKEADRASDTLKKVPGAEKFVNGIVPIDSPSTKLSTNSSGGYINSSKITTIIKAKLLGEVRESALNINVQTYRGIVNLCGFVKDKQERNAVLAATKNVRGVMKVVDNLVIAKP